MSMRLSVDLVFLSLIGAIASWLARAPADPADRAAYLCAPVFAVERAGARLQSAMADDGTTIAPAAPWHADPGRACVRLVIRFSQTPAP